MKEKHGTRYAYNHGCRCAKCTKANSAWAWAQRKAKNWDTPIRAIFSECASIDGGKTLVPTEVLLAAFRKYEQKIGCEALAEIWRRKQKKETEI